MQTVCCLQQGGFKQPLPLLSHSNLDRGTKVPRKLGGKGAQPPPLSPGERRLHLGTHTTLPSIPLLVVLGVPAPGTRWLVHGQQESGD